MAQSLHKTKRRIASIQSTKKITKAMELVATVKFKKYRRVMEANQQYTMEIHDLIHALFAHLTSEEIPYLKQGKGEQDLYVVINSTLGLCASYNNEMFNYIKKNVPQEHSVLLPIGLKGAKFYAHEGYQLDQTFVHLNEQLKYEDIMQLGNTLHHEFLKGTYCGIYLIYTHYQNSITFVPHKIQLFPLNKKETKADIGYAPIFDPNAKTLIEELIPIYLNSILYQRIVESQVSEQASRRTAMENASDNADDLIEELTLQFNKARQAAITQEISEIVSSKN